MADVGKAIRTRLLSVSAVTDLVSTRIYPLTLPQGVTMPAVRYQRVSGNSDPHVRGTTGAATARLQFDISPIPMLVLKHYVMPYVRPLTNTQGPAVV